MKPITNINDPRYVKAMSHPLRVRLLAMLHEQKASPVVLAERLGTSLGVVAYHVRTLERLGLIELVGESRKRGAVEHHYQAKERPSVSDEAWGRASPIAKQAAVGASLQIIDEYARASAAAGGFDRADTHLTRTILRLDEKGYAQLAKACQRLLNEVDRIEEGAAARIARDPHAEGIVDAGVVLLLFEAVRLSQQQPASGRVSRDAGQKKRTPPRRRQAGAR